MKEGARGLVRNYADTECEKTDRPRAFTLKDQVQEQIESLQKRLNEQEELQKLLEAHPEIERAFTLLGNR